MSLKCQLVSERMCPPSQLTNSSFVTRDSFGHIQLLLIVESLLFVYWFADCRISETVHIRLKILPVLRTMPINIIRIKFFARSFRFVARSLRIMRKKIFRYVLRLSCL